MKRLVMMLVLIGLTGCAVPQSVKRAYVYVYDALNPTNKVESKK